MNMRSIINESMKQQEEKKKQQARYFIADVTKRPPEIMARSNSFSWCVMCAQNEKMLVFDTWNDCWIYDGANDILMACF